MINLRVITSFLNTSVVFCGDPERMGFWEIDELPISDNLKNDLKVWNNEFQKIYNEAYPPDSKFPTDEAERLHIIQGEKLTDRLQAELGDEYKVTYCR